MANRNRNIGKWGEDLAAAYLEGKGYFILDRNVYTSYGEIDIITLQDDPGELPPLPAAKPGNHLV